MATLFSASWLVWFLDVENKGVHDECTGWSGLGGWMDGLMAELMDCVKMDPRL